MVDAHEDAPAVSAQPNTPLSRWIAAHPHNRGGQRRSLRTLTPEQVARMRAAPPELYRALAWELMISHVAAWKIRRYITYRDLP